MRFKVQGQSMYPFLKPLEEVELIYVPHNKVKTGDVVAYFDSMAKVMTVHRVVRKSQRHLIVKGDNNWKIDDNFICSPDVWIVDKIYKDRERVVSVHTFYGRLVNIMCLFLSVLRINYLLFGRKISYDIKIGGRVVTDKVYMKFKKYIDVNNKKDI